MGELSRVRDELLRVRELGPDGAPIDPSPLLADYLSFHADRYRLTLRELEGISGRDLLDVGPSLPFTTLVAARTGARVSCVSGEFPIDGRTLVPGERTLTAELDGRRFAFPLRTGVNLERDALPWADGSFDVVLLLEVIEHLALDPVWTLCEVARVLRPGGRLVLTTDNANSLVKLMKLIALRPIYWPLPRRAMGDRHHREYLRAELVDLLSGIGFRAVRVRAVNLRPYRARESVKKAMGYGLANLLTLLPPLSVYRRQLIAVAERGEARPYRPGWLFRGSDEAAFAG